MQDKKDANQPKPAQDQDDRAFSGWRTSVNLSVLFKKTASLSHRLAEVPAIRPKEMKVYRTIKS